MIRPVEAVRVHLCRDAVDFRKQIRGLSVVVEEAFELDPFAAGQKVAGVHQARARLVEQARVDELRGQSK